MAEQLVPVATFRRPIDAELAKSKLEAGGVRSFIEQLVGLGVSWVWMGIEGQDSRYSKLNGIDTFELIKELQSHGIRVLGSTIIGLENHTPENICDQLPIDQPRHQVSLRRRWR